MHISFLSLFLSILPEDESLEDLLMPPNVGEWVEKKSGDIDFSRSCSCSTMILRPGESETYENTKKVIKYNHYQTNQYLYNLHLHPI